MPCNQQPDTYSLSDPTTRYTHNHLSTFFEGLSETANKGKMFDQYLLNEKSKHHFIDEIVDIALTIDTDSPIHIHKFIPPEV
jgi:hypothetical protein